MGRADADNVNYEIEYEQEESIGSEDEYTEPKFIGWIKKYKYGILAFTGAILAGVVTYKNREAIGGFFYDYLPKLRDSSLMQGSDYRLTEEKKIIPDGFKLSGNRMTPSEIGTRMMCSAQQVNKRLVDLGLAKKMPSGDYMFTDYGEGLGEVTHKITKYGYPFSNIEWDESVIGLIFTSDEIARTGERRRELDELVRGYKM